MTAENFLDTNILLYAFSGASEDVEKSKICKELLLISDAAISSQVMQEFVSTALRKPALGISESAIDVMVEYSLEIPVLPVSREVIMKGVELRRRFQLSHWDSTIVAAGLEMSCSVLYSEDLHHGQSFDGLKVRNPFR